MSKIEKVFFATIGVILFIILMGPLVIVMWRDALKYCS